MALVRYLAADALRAERWAAPVLTFLAAVVAFNAGGGSALSGYGFGATVLLPVALWLTIAVSNSEDPVQTSITVVTVGSPFRVRLATLALAYLICLPLSLVGIVWPLLSGHTAAGIDIVAGMTAHLLTALAGVAFGALLSRPVLDRLAWVVLAAVAICLAEVVVPGFPPLRQLLNLFAEEPLDPGAVARPLALIAARTVVLSGALLAVAHRIALDRT